MRENELIELEEFYSSNRKDTDLFPYISQREDWDCGVACYAMATNKTYQEARKVWPKRPQRGISGYSLAKLLLSRELSRPPALRSLDYYLDDGKNYILLTKAHKGDWGHYVIKDANNNIYDPEYAICSMDEYPRKYVSFHILIEPIP